MIIGVGTDLVEIRRVEQACEHRAFLEKVYTEQERELIAAGKHRAAGNFAVKEAVSKVFGTGFSRIRPNEIEVLRDERGKPYVNLYGEAKRLAGELGIRNLAVSISNTKELAIAYAIGETQETPGIRTDERDANTEMSMLRNIELKDNTGAEYAGSDQKKEEEDGDGMDT